MSDDDFERQLGFLDATSIALGTMIGGGIFILPSIAAGQAGPASTISFVVAGVVSLLSALSHAEVATDMLDSEGGSYEYVRRALGPIFGSIVGWGMWVGLIFASAFYARGFAQYLAYFMGELPIVPIAAALAVALIAVNYYGAAEAGRIEDAIVLSLLLLLVVFIASGLPAVEPTRLRPFAPNGWGAVLATTGTIYVSFIGFAVIATATAEIENPGRNVPLAMIVAVVIPTVMYAFVMVVSTGVLPVEELQESRVPVAQVAAEYAGGLGAAAMVVGAVLATISSANASILAASRVSYAMGSERVLTDWLEQTSERFGTPSRAIATTGIGIVALLVLRVRIDVLAEVASFMYLLTYGLVHVAVILLRRGGEAYDPEFRIPDAFYPAVPILGVLATVAIMTQMSAVVIGGGVVLTAAASVWYLVYVRLWQ
jgi:amino acid transporter